MRSHVRACLIVYGYCHKDLMLRTESSLPSDGQVEEGCGCSRKAWGTRAPTKCWHIHCREKRTVATCALLLLCVSVGARSSGAVSIAAPPIPTKPYRVLLVVEHWSDPYGLVVSSEVDKFQPVAALLKTWSIPFDILRLDQQHLDATYLFRRSGGIRYGAVVWLADPASYGDQDVASLEEATRAGTGLIVVDSRALDSTLGRLLGLKFKDFYTSTDILQVTKEHFITRDVAAGKDALPAWHFIPRSRVLGEQLLRAGQERSPPDRDAAQLGHSDIGTTLDIYTQITDPEVARMVNRVTNRILGLGEKVDSGSIQ